MSLDRLPARSSSGAFHVVVESPRGSALKLKYEPALGVVVLSRPLPLGLRYPFDWGFVPSTRAPDGDPLDAAVLVEAGSYPGVVIACRAIGLIALEQDKKDRSGRERNDRILAAPISAPRLHHVRDERDLAPRIREEIEQFFLNAVFFEPKNARILGWSGALAAEAAIDRAAQA